MSSKPMSPTTHRLFEYMLSRKGEDVLISDMYKVVMQTPKVFEPEDDESPDARRQQQYVGAYVSRVNLARIHYKIIPGELKRTYRIVQKNT